MERNAVFILIGGAISLTSTVVGIALQYWLDILKSSRKIKEHPTRVLYEKQTEFYDKLANVLPEVNGYITAIDVWLGETSSEAPQRLKKAAEENEPITKLNELLERYHMYLPERILAHGNELFVECLLLSTSQRFDQAEKCLQLLFSFQNEIRASVGVDKLSHELLKAFGASKQMQKNRRKDGRKE